MRDLKWFDSLKKRDFENGAVIAEIAAVFKDNAKLKERLRGIEEVLQQIKEWCECCTCEICGQKEMTDTDCYDYVKKACEEK